MTSAINLGTEIYRLRKESRLTQDDLASFLGVTKASVSKWETGQSYPDIELLPKLATYFGTTVDARIGYEPQLSKADIRRECDRLRAAFATQPFEEAHAECQQLARDYYSCYPLLVQIAMLYLNHMNLVDVAERGQLVEEAIDLCRRVRKNSESSADVTQAESTEAMFHLMAGNPQAAVDVLPDAAEVDMGADVLLANAYQTMGRFDDADMTLQAALFQGIVLSVQRLSSLAMLYAGNPAKLDAAHARATALIDAFDLERIFLNCGAIHLTFAMAYLMGGNTSAALDCLEDYERACRKLEFPLKLHGDAFFDKVEAWIEEVNTAGTSAPRDEAFIKQSMVASVAANPAFAPLAGDPRFQCVVANLQEIAR